MTNNEEFYTEEEKRFLNANIDAQALKEQLIHFSRNIEEVNAQALAMHQILEAETKADHQFAKNIWHFLRVMENLIEEHGNKLDRRSFNMVRKDTEEQIADIERKRKDFLDDEDNEENTDVDVNENIKKSSNVVEGDFFVNLDTDEEIQRKIDIIFQDVHTEDDDDQ